MDFLVSVMILVTIYDGLTLDRLYYCLYFYFSDFIVIHKIVSVTQKFLKKLDWCHTQKNQNH